MPGGSDLDRGSKLRGAPDVLTPPLSRLLKFRSRTDGQLEEDGSRSGDETT